MQETAQIILQASFEYPCNCIGSNQPTLKRFKVCHPSQENCQDNCNNFCSTIEQQLPTTKTTHLHGRKTKPANIMKLKNIFGMSSASSTNCKLATNAQQQQTMRKGKEDYFLKHNHFTSNFPKGRIHGGGYLSPQVRTQVLL